MQYSGSCQVVVRGWIHKSARKEMTACPLAVARRAERGQKPKASVRRKAAIRSARDRSREAETAEAGSVHESPTRRGAPRG